MGKPNFSEDFKRDAVRQITVRGYAVREVSERLGVSTYSLYKWIKVYLAVIIDLYSRRVIGWAVSNRMKRDMAIRALDMAVALRQPPGTASTMRTAVPYIARTNTTGACQIAGFWYRCAGKETAAILP